MTWNTEVFSDNDTSDPVGFQPYRFTDLYSCNSSRPKYRSRFNAFLADLHPVDIDVTDHAACPDLNAKFFKGSCCFACKFRVKRTKDARCRFDNENPGQLRINVTIKF